MNSKQHNKSQDQDMEKIKEIPKWTRRYAQNRTLTTFVLLVMVCLISMVIMPPLMCLIIGFHKGNMILAGVGIALLIPVSIFFIIFLLKFGGKNRGLIDQLIEQRIYGKEGAVSMPLPKTTKKMRWLDFVGGVIVFICAIGTMNLYMASYISVKNLLPVTAIYGVPFLIFQYLFQRPRLGPLLLLCPILYTVHAVLVLVGVPIFFTGNWGICNMAIPLFGYTFLAYAVGHFYSRYALKKLKTAAHLEENTNGQ